MSSTLTIQAFIFDPELTERFIQFAYDLYRDDAQWLPPLRQELARLLSPAASFYHQQGNAHRLFLATLGGQTAGRIAAMVNRALRDATGTPVGSVGFFECIHDPDVAHALLTAATQWLRDEHGITCIWGPMNFDIWRGYRLMTRGFAARPFYTEPYNKPYYAAFFERSGFVPKQRWHSVTVQGRSALEAMIARGQGRYRAVLDQGYRFDDFNLQQFDAELRKLHWVILRSFRHFIGFTPIALDEFLQLFANVRGIIQPRLMTFIAAPHGDLVAFAVAYPDPTAAIRAMQGEAQRFARYIQETDRILFYLGGIVPEEAARHQGLGRAGLYHIVHRLLDAGHDQVVFTLMAEGNPVRGLLRGHASRAEREYTLYELHI